MGPVDRTTFKRWFYVLCAELFVGGVLVNALDGTAAKAVGYSALAVFIAGLVILGRAHRRSSVDD